MKRIEFFISMPLNLARIQQQYKLCNPHQQRGVHSQSPLSPSVSLVTPDFDFRHMAESMVSKIVGLMHDKYYPLYD
jgi:hypothetical protein